MSLSFASFFFSEEVDQNSQNHKDALRDKEPCVSFCTCVYAVCFLNSCFGSRWSDTISSALNCPCLISKHVKVIHVFLCSFKIELVQFFPCIQIIFILSKHIIIRKLREIFYFLSCWRLLIAVYACGTS